MTLASSQALDIDFEETFPLRALSTPDVGGLGWGTAEIGKVRATINKWGHSGETDHLIYKAVHGLDPLTCVTGPALPWRYVAKVQAITGNRRVVLHKPSLSERDCDSPSYSINLSLGAPSAFERNRPLRNVRHATKRVQIW